MNCPVCGGKTKIQCCRADCEIVARRRKCEECDHIFFTVESESDNARQEFNRLEKEYRSELKMEKIRRILLYEKSK